MCPGHQRVNVGTLQAFELVSQHHHVVDWKMPKEKRGMSKPLHGHTRHGRSVSRRPDHGGMLVSGNSRCMNRHVMPPSDTAGTWHVYKHVCQYYHLATIKCGRCSNVVALTAM